MADFSTDIGSRPSSAIQPLAPVMDRTAGASSKMTQTLVEGAGGIFDVLGVVNDKNAKRAEQAAQDKAIAEFGQGQLSLAEAAETGAMSTKEVRSRMRANLQSAIADNPALAIDLGKAHTALIKSTGLGQVAYEGTSEEKLQADLENTVVKNGWVAADAPQQEKDAAVTAYSRFQKSVDMMGFEQKQISLQASKIGLSTAQTQRQTAQLQLQEQAQKKQSQLAVGQLANNYMVKLNNTLEDIRRKKEAGSINALDAVMLVDRAYLEVDQVTRQVGAQAGSEYVSNLTAPMKQLVSDYKGYMDGKVVLDDLNSRRDTTVAIQANLALGDPELARVAGVSTIIKNGDALLQANAQSAVARYFEINSDETTKPADIMPDYAQGKDEVGSYLGLVKNTIGKVNAGTAIEQETAIKEINANLVNVLRGIDVYGPNATSLGDYAPVLDFLADASVGKYIVKQGGFTDAATANKAGQVLEQNYANQVLPLVKEEFDRTMSGGSVNIRSYGRTEVPTVEGQKPTSELVKVRFSGSGISFVPTDPADNNALTRNRIKELNSKVQPIVNKLIRVSAHLSGTTDYKAIYDANYAGLFEKEAVKDVTGE